VLPTLHLSIVLFSYLVIFIPGHGSLGLLFTYVLVADLPISIVTYAVVMVYPVLGFIWILLAGTAWWHLLGRGLEALISKVTNRNESAPRLLP
jgi:hypothetical protein